MTYAPAPPAPGQPQPPGQPGSRGLPPSRSNLMGARPTSTGLPALAKQFLLPGEMAFVRDPAVLETLLGSCIAVILHDPQRGWGGMNHYMVPMPTGTMHAGKVGATAIPQLIQMATLSGCLPSKLQATLVGGGAVIGHLGGASEVAGIDVGRRNILIAVESLQRAGVAIIRQEVGGTTGRRVSFDSKSGMVSVRAIEPNAEREARAAKIEALRQRRARILIVDDSATVRRLLRSIIEDSDDLEVVAEAEDPFAARQALLEHDPDALCLDVIMPRLDGLSFLRRLMQHKPIPTVVVSTIAKAGSAMANDLAAAGAVAVIDKDALEIYRGRDVAAAVLLPALRKAVTAVVQRRSP
jgi:two-component system chemotaxis response regulator CheB